MFKSSRARDLDTLASQDVEDQLFHLVNELAYREGDFTLASGRQSPHYFNGKLVLLEPRGAVLFAEWILMQYRSLPEQPVAIGGLELGAVPIAAVVMALDRHIRAFIVRRKPKLHGTSLMIDGTLYEGDPVIVVDDVITTGSSTLKAIQAVEAAGCHVVAVYSLVDRQEDHLPEFAPYYDRLNSVLTLNQFLQKRTACRE